MDNTSSGTSVIAPSNASKEKYDNDLKEFLTPILSTKEARKTKTYGRKLKSYAEALGIEVQPQEVKEKRNKKASKKNNEVESPTHSKALTEEIWALKTQIALLSELVANLCSLANYNDEKQKEINEKLQAIKDLETYPNQNSKQAANAETTAERNNNLPSNKENSPKQTPQKNTKIRKHNSLTAEQEATGPFRSAVKAAFQASQFKKQKENSNVENE